MHQTTSPSRAPRGRRAPLAAIALGALLVATGSQARVEAPAEGVWITLGEEALATLVADGLRQGGLPLQRFAGGGGVVLTRVDPRDLDRIAARLHAAHRRCAGFVLHGSAAEGLDALAALDRRPARGALAELTLDQRPVVERLQAAVAEPPVLESMVRLSSDFANRFCEHPPGVAAALWIRDRWLELAADRPDVTVELWPHDDWPQPSVVLTLPGADLPDEVVILGGHLDSTRQGSTEDPDFLAPGADDNASGIAVLLEVARVALSEGFRPRRTVQLMAYAAEEIGLGGSLDIAGAYKEQGVDVVAVLQLDMTGYFGSTEDIALIDDFVDPALTDFLGELLDAYQPELLWTTTLCGYPCSDHASWIINGYDAAFPFEAEFFEHNPWIHTDQDTVATLGNSAAHAAKFARLAAAFMVEVAKSAEDPLFADGFETGTT